MRLIIFIVISLVFSIGAAHAQEIQDPPKKPEIKNIEIKSISRDLKSNLRDNNHRAKIIAKRRAIMNQKRAIHEKKMKQQTLRRSKLRKDQIRKRKQIIQRRRLNR